MSSLILNLASDASVRGMVAPDGSHRFSVYDFITMACQKADGGVYARKVFSRLVTDESDFKNEIVSLCHNIHFPGGRGAATPTMTLRGLQRLLLILGTKVAAEFRALLEGTFTRVMAGDTSLIDVIESNAASDAPIHQAYRQALEQEPVAPVLDEMGDNPLKRKREELEIKKMEIEMRDMDMKSKLEIMKAKFVIMEKYQELCKDTTTDEKAKSVFKNDILSNCFSSEGLDEPNAIVPQKQYDTFFSKLISTSWKNNHSPGVNLFRKLPKDENNNVLREPSAAIQQLKVQTSSGLDPAIYPQYANLRYRAFGFCFKGPPITEWDLQRTTFIKEAYGVEHEGVHYVCIVFFKPTRLCSFPTLPYFLGLLTCNAVPQLVPGSDHHISVYKTCTSTADPILEMLKRPSESKWYWHSPMSG